MAGKLIKSVIIFFVSTSSVLATERPTQKELTPMMKRLADPDYQMTAAEKAFQKKNGQKYYRILQNHKSTPRQGIQTYAKEATQDCQRLPEAYRDASAADVELCQKVAGYLPNLAAELFDKATVSEKNNFYSILIKATRLQAEGRSQEVPQLLEKHFTAQLETAAKP